MRIVRLTPEQARAVGAQLARAALFIRQMIESFVVIARRAAEAIEPLNRLAVQLAAHRA